MTSSCIDILLAEDDEDLREAMVETLSDAGYTVEAVGNGRDAIEWLEDAAHPPKLILLDLMMPIMDGWQFLEKREKTPKVAAVPVVILSASAKFDSTNDDSVVHAKTRRGEAVARHRRELLLARGLDPLSPPARSQARAR